MKRKSFSEFGRVKQQVKGCEVCGKTPEGRLTLSLSKLAEGRGLGPLVTKESFVACELHVVDLYEELLAMAQDAVNARPRAVA